MLWGHPLSTGIMGLFYRTRKRATERWYWEVLWITFWVNDLLEEHLELNYLSSHILVHYSRGWNVGFKKGSQPIGQLPKSWIPTGSVIVSQKWYNAIHIDYKKLPFVLVSRYFIGDWSLRYSWQITCLDLVPWPSRSQVDSACPRLFVAYC